MSVRRLAIVIPRLQSGGAERVVSGLANYAAKKDIQVSVIRYDEEEPFYEINNKVEVISLKAYMPSKNLYQKIVYNIKRIFVLRRAFKDISPDIIISFLSSACFLSLIARLGLNIPLIMTERNNPYISPSKKIWRLLRFFSFYFADGYIFQTERAKSYFPEKVANKSIVIPNPIINPYLNKEIYFPKEKKITAMGRLVDQKRFDCLIRAFSRIEKDFPEYNLIIYGEGEKREQLLHIIDKMNLNDRVFMPGAREKAIEEISRSAVFVLSSKFEGMPNALIEAMACGVPCISTNCEMGPAELIQDHVNGILVSVDNEEEIAEAIKEIISEKELSRKLSEEAFKIRKVLNPDKIFSEIIQYFDHVIKANNIY